MPKETPIQRRRRIAAHTGVTSLITDFAHICKRHPSRIGIVAEGDSWFAYPRKFVAFGADINIVHHIEDKVASTDTVNLLRLACNGDEAVAMMSGKQKAQMAKLLARQGQHIHLILFSGGGNDIVGKRDMLPLLNVYQAGFSAAQCIHQARFARKLDAIILAYQELIDLRDEYAPHAKIVTHCYDIAQPSPKGAEFFWGLIKTEPWIYPYLIERNIPSDLHREIVEILLGTLRLRLLALAQQPENLGAFYAVDTQGILRPGNALDWLNEIHPTEAGFKKITQPIYAKLLELQPDLPVW